MRGSGLIFAGCWLLTGGCAFLYHYGDYTSANDSDAGGDGGSGIGGGGGTFPAGGGAGGDAGADAAPRTAYYVSPNGDDANDGLAPNKAKRSIAAGISAATGSATPAEVRVCKGTFAEPDLSLDAPVSLLGGFDCSTFQRSATYGFPTFDGVNESIIQAPASSTSGIALQVTGAAIDRGVLIDGFSIVGLAPSKIPTRGVWVDDGASPVISNCIVRGGDGVSDNGVGSIGVAIGANAAPELALSVINGGSGVGVVFDDVACHVVQAGAASIHDCRLIAASNPAGKAGTVGLYLEKVSLTQAQNAAVARNYVYGGDGPVTTRGIYATSSSVDLVGNQVDGGKGGAILSAGVALVGVDAATLRQNRVYGGDIAVGSQLVTGIYANTVESLVVENNFVYGGNRTGVNQTTNLAGLAIANGSAQIIHHNTIFSGPSPSDVGSAGIIAGGTTAQVIENNIVFGDGQTDAAILLTACAGAGAVRSLRNNAFFGFTVMATFGFVDAACSAPKNLDTVATLESELSTTCTSTTAGPCQAFGGAQASGNLRLNTSCTPAEGATCAVLGGCDGNENCGAALFSGYAPSNHGYDAFLNSGFSLKTPSPCAVTKGAIDLGVTQDLFGTARTPPPSIGAFESDGACN